MRSNMPVSNVEYVLKDIEAVVSKTDLHGNITCVNQDFVNISGFSEEELVGSPQNFVHHPDMPEEVFADLWRTVKSGKAWTGLVKNRCKNGDYYWVEANTAPIIDNHEIVGYASESELFPLLVAAAGRREFLRPRGRDRPRPRLRQGRHDITQYRQRRPLATHAVQLEYTHRLGQPGRLILQALGRRRRLFNQGCVLLRHLVHLTDRLVDLLDAGALLLARRSNLAHDVGHPFDRADNLVHGLAGFVHQLAAGLDFADGVFNQGLDLLGRTGAALAQFTQIKAAFDATQEVILGNVFVEVERVEKSILATCLTPHHR